VGKGAFIGPCREPQNSQFVYYYYYKTFKGGGVPVKSSECPECGTMVERSGYDYLGGNRRFKCLACGAEFFER